MLQSSFVESVGVRELRNNVAALLRRAGSGERIVITADGTPVAQLGPIEPGGTVSLEDLVATGLLDPPRRPGSPAEADAVDLPVDIRLDDVLTALRGRA